MENIKYLKYLPNCFALFYLVISFFSILLIEPKLLRLEKDKAIAKTDEEKK